MCGDGVEDRLAYIGLFEGRRSVEGGDFPVFDRQRDVVAFVGELAVAAPAGHAEGHALHGVGAVLARRGFVVPAREVRHDFARVKGLFAAAFRPVLNVALFDVIVALGRLVFVGDIGVSLFVVIVVRVAEGGVQNVPPIVHPLRLRVLLLCKAVMLDLRGLAV